MLHDAAYFITISHLNQWTNAQINDLITQIYHENKSDLREFFSLSEDDWKNLYNIDEKKLASLREAKEQIVNNSLLAETLMKQGFELIPLLSPDYSETLKDNLKSNTPPLLYVKGNKQLLLDDSVAIVGSRDASANGLKFTENVAKKATENYQAIVSGFAKGIDRAALDFTLKYIGHSIIVLPQGVLTFASGYKTYYSQIVEGDVLVLSTFHPQAPWNVKLAMARNPIIYGLAKEIYVADSAEKGGTWNGVKDGLRKGRTIFVRRPEEHEINANNLLIDMGAQAVDIFGNPESLQVPESLAEPLPNKEELKDKILKLLKNSALTAKDVCEQLGSEMTPQMMGKMLSNMKDVEKKKTGKVVKYSVKQRHELFDMS
ncbi:MAG: DNA-processing protein DprA [Candidatus Cloacimonetes bacterium]|nr:DNA-processing protein DprA [Candidatus Cloacimonadota bacterium]